MGVPGDVETLANGLGAALNAQGEWEIDILVHNAGCHVMGRPIEMLATAEFDRMIAVNVKAPVFLT